MSIFFNAFHSPLGAHSSFTLGCKGKSGGLGLEMGKPAYENVYIGLENTMNTYFSLLPFFSDEGSESFRYDHGNTQEESESFISCFPDNKINRTFKTGSDSWKAEDLEFNILSAPVIAPDPMQSTKEEQMFAYCPAVLAELTIDNTNCTKNRTAIFGYNPQNSTDSLNKIHNLPEGFHGIARGRTTGVFY